MWKKGRWRGLGFSGGLTYVGDRPGDDTNALSIAPYAGCTATPASRSDFSLLAGSVLSALAACKLQRRQHKPSIVGTDDPRPAQDIDAE